jgi:ubiquinone/menaquinone biosynthesis C-methylase UbiE
LLRDKSKDEITSYFDSISSGYGSFRGEGRRLLSNFEIRQLLAQILGRTDPISSVLDVGCGWGRHLSLVSRHCSTAIGIDISKRMLLTGKKRFTNQNIEFVQADMEQLPFRDATFNIVYSIRALNYSFNQNETLKEIRRVSNSNCHIMLYLINNILSFSYFTHLINSFLKFIFRQPHSAWQIGGTYMSNPFSIKEALGVSGLKNVSYIGILYVPESVYDYPRLKRLFRRLIFLEGAVPSFFSSFAYGILYCSKSTTIEIKKKTC